MASTSKRKFFKNIVTLVVLSEDEDIQGAELGTIAYEIVNGDWSGGDVKIESTQVDGAEMARLLQEQGSDPEFFRLNEDGSDCDGESENEDISEYLRAFFWVEIRNEKHDGVSPATLGSALDSWKQAPSDVLLDWCGWVDDEQSPPSKTVLSETRKELEALIQANHAGTFLGHFLD